MVESDAADALTGDPFALIPAATLVGYRGITYVRPSDWVEIIQLHFAKDEIVFANVGALFLCHSQEDLMSDMGSDAYEVLAMDAAEDLVDCLMYQDDALRDRTCPTAAAKQRRGVSRDSYGAKSAPILSMA